jgi:hypothetical protein
MVLKGFSIGSQVYATSYEAAWRDLLRVRNVVLKTNVFHLMAMVRLATSRCASEVSTYGACRAALAKLQAGSIRPGEMDEFDY